MKKILSLLLTLALAALPLTACGKTDETVQDTAASAADTAASAAAPVTEEMPDPVTVRLGALKGPTAMGLAKLITDAQEGAGETADWLTCDVTLAAAADELTPALIQGELDLAAVPANLASVLYHKTEGAIQLLAVGNLGVLDIVTTDASIQSFADLKGKTILATGQGTTPEYALRYLLAQNGLDADSDVTLEWKSEAAEVLSALAASTEEPIAMLPQPYVTVAQNQIADLRIAVDLNEAWNDLDNGSALVTGVLVGRKDFIAANPEAVAAFLEAYRASIDYANANGADAAQMIEALDIVKSAIAQKALPYCNLHFMTGDEMKQAVSGYLQTLYDQNPQAVGGALPDDDFYYADPQFIEQPAA